MSPKFSRVRVFLPMLLFSIAVLSCGTSPYEYPAFSKNGHINVVVEIPAGTNLKYEFSPETEEFEVEIIDGKRRMVQFLPYPGNYGFIPSTLMDKSRGGDGDALDILVISESLPQGMVVEVIPVAVLHLSDRGETDDKIVAVPAEADLRTINCTTLSCMEDNYPEALSIIQGWFSSYKGSGKMKFLGWADENKAMSEIKKWSVSDEKK
ncbi:inorganic diphosphatase [Fulvivirga kasyanovii]|uniref:inorganic diphosphatase n=1 Tax=Fulvivirga kasyanovii TaxID=396812 RepID=A0ABW9RXL3_9BACT|nr:inorganic diphosphatase [Fulvivirga kasyanovii]MTI29002.1 inorganic diphosphatase [Fulvivirga kasyanovii]